MITKDELDGYLRAATVAARELRGVIFLGSDMVVLLKEMVALRDLSKLFPKCEHIDINCCGRTSRREETGGMGDDFNVLYWCDEHGEWPRRGGDVYDTDWAALARKLEL